MRAKSGRRSPLFALFAGLLALVVIVGLVYLLTRDDGPPSADEQVAQQESCAPLLRFSSLLSDLTQGGSATTADAAKLFDQVGVQPDALIAAAPGKVRDDVRTLVGVVRAQPSQGAAYREPAFTLARERLAAHVGSPESGCQSGSESGDG